jgi:hypothetical protein
LAIQIEALGQKLAELRKQALQRLAGEG